MKDFKVYANFKQVKENDHLYIEGYASIETVDREYEVILSSSARAAIEKTMNDFMKNPVLLYMHKWEIPIGKVVSYLIDDKGLFIKAMISNSKSCDEYREKIEEGILKALSIGFRSIDSEYDSKADIFVIKSIEMYEISVVTIPANRDALFDVVKKCLKKPTIKNEGKEGKKMSGITEEKYFQTFEQLKNAEKDNALLKRETEYLQKQLDENKVKNDEAKADIQKTLENWDADKKANDKTIAELKAQIEEFKNKGIHFEKGADPEKANPVSQKQFDSMKFDMERKSFHEMERDYALNRMYDFNEKGQIVATKCDRFEYSDDEVVKSYMKQNGVEFDENDAEHKKLVESMLARKAISSTTGINRVNEVDYDPINMSYQRSPLVGLTPMMKMDSKTYEWYQRTAKNSAPFAEEGFTPVETNSTYEKKEKSLKSQYGASSVNDFAEKVSGISMIMLELEGIDQAMDEELNWTLINGNETADSYAFDGLIGGYIHNDEDQFINNNGTVFSLDIVDDVEGQFKELIQQNTTEGKRPNAYLCDTRTFTKIKKLLRAEYSGVTVSIKGTLTINGIVYNAIHHDNILFIECDDLRDYSHTAPTVVASAVSGGALADATTFYARVSVVTAQGESTASTEVNAATSSPNLTIRLAVTAQTGDKYYKVYWGTSTGHTNLKWIKTVKATGSDLNIDIAATPTQKYEKCLDDSNNGVFVATKIGGRDGLEIGFNEYKTFVRLAKTADKERFYKRSYICGKLKNEYAVLKEIHDLA